MDNFYEINTESHYFVPLRPLHNYGFVSMTSSSDEPHLIECRLAPYHFSDFGYKLYAVPADPDLDGVFERRTFYSSDFKSLLRDGYIIEKTDERMCVMPIEALEHLCGAAYLRHSGEVITIKEGA